MIKFHRILPLILAAVFLAGAADIARYAAGSCTQSRMYAALRLTVTEGGLDILSLRFSPEENGENDVPIR